MMIVNVKNGKIGRFRVCIFDYMLFVGPYWY